MKLTEFEDRIGKIADNHFWKIYLERNDGIWILTVIEEETDKCVMSTGGTGLGGLLLWFEKKLKNNKFKKL